MNIFKPIQVTHSQFPQNPPADESAQRRVLDTSKRIPGVYSFYDRYQSRVSIGKHQYTLGTGTLHACMRLTNAALLFFWGYRQRPLRDPIDTDFPVGLDIAQSDLLNCAWLANYLREIECNLIANKLVDPASKRTIRNTPKKFDREKFLTVWAMFKGEAAQALNELRLAGDPARIIHVTMAESLDTLSKTIETADRAILKPGSMAPRDASLDQPL
jgi:hypothetical protein